MKKKDCCKVMALRVASRRRNKYYYRHCAKKRKCTSMNHHRNSNHSLKLPPPKRKSPIACMPTNVLEKIFSYIDNDELAITVRLVNHRFRILSQNVLNQTFKNLEQRLMTVKMIFLASLRHSGSDLETKCMCKLINTIELLILHYSLLKATIWKFITKKYDSANWCMHGGIILDVFNMVLRDITGRPPDVYYSTVPSDVKNLCKMINKFCLHFDKISENNFDRSFNAGTKLLDLLDCAIFAERKTLKCQLLNNYLCLEISYYFPYSWFIAFDVPKDKTLSWCDVQKLMYMRIRRIVTAHTEMQLRECQFERECTFRTNPAKAIKLPTNSIYTGYGEAMGKFFYYGVMNQGAFSDKFGFDVETDREHNFDDVNLNAETKPYLGLEIKVSLHCPYLMAPYNILKNMDEKFKFPYTVWQGKRLAKGNFYMKIDFICPYSKYVNLPSTYFVEFDEKR